VGEGGEGVEVDGGLETGVGCAGVCAEGLEGLGEHLLGCLCHVSKSSLGL